MKINMTTEQALEFVESYTKGAQIHEGLWNEQAAMLVLADEVRRLRGEAAPSAAHTQLGDGLDGLRTGTYVDGKWVPVEIGKEQPAA